MKRNKLVLIFILFVFFSCNKKNSPTDTPTSGEINISVDETIRPLIEAELETFHALYKRTFVSTDYTNEAKAFEKLLKDSSRLIVVSRTLTDQENKIFQDIKLKPRITKIAIDAIALVVNNANTDTALTYSQLKDIFNGKIQRWNQINPASKLGQIQVVFDNKNSSTTDFIIEKVNDGNALPSFCFAVNSNSEVINYTAQHKNTIGVIGVNWISDSDDSTAIGFLEKIKVVGISSDSSGNFYQPYQAYIAQKTYPLQRDIYIISREARVGLGTGFAAFVASDRGQRIVLKSGLLPATMPIRIVQLNSNSF